MRLQPAKISPQRCWLRARIHLAAHECCLHTPLRNCLRFLLHAPPTRSFHHAVLLQQLNLGGGGPTNGILCVCAHLLDHGCELLFACVQHNARCRRLPCQHNAAFRSSTCRGCLLPASRHVNVVRPSWRAGALQVKPMCVAWRLAPRLGRSGEARHGRVFILVIASMSR